MIGKRLLVLLSALVAGCAHAQPLAPVDKKLIYSLRWNGVEKASFTVEARRGLPEDWMFGNQWVFANMVEDPGNILKNRPMEGRRGPSSWTAGDFFTGLTDPPISYVDGGEFPMYLPRDGRYVFLYSAAVTDEYLAMVGKIQRPRPQWRRLFFNERYSKPGFELPAIRIDLNKPGNERIVQVIDLEPSIRRAAAIDARHPHTQASPPATQSAPPAIKHPEQ